MQYRCLNLFNRKDIEELAILEKRYRNGAGLMNQLMTLLTMLIQVRIDCQDKCRNVLMTDVLACDISNYSQVIELDEIINFKITNENLLNAQKKVQLASRIKINEVLGNFSPEFKWKLPGNENKYKFQWYKYFFPEEIISTYQCIKFSDKFLNLGCEIAKSLKLYSEKNVSVVHLRVEDRNIKVTKNNYYSKESNDELKNIFMEKYRNVITKYIPKNSFIYICGDAVLSREILEYIFPGEMNYKLISVDKSPYEKELGMYGHNIRALIELCIVMHINAENLICMHDIRTYIEGSTFSFWMMLHFMELTTKVICLDMRDMEKPELEFRKLCYTPFFLEK